MLENPPQHDAGTPRASLVATAMVRGREIEVWVGGAHTAIGLPITAESVKTAALVDCAGDLPLSLRTAALHFQPFVFLDVEERPSAFPRLVEIVDGLVRQCHEISGPRQLHAVCTHGMNRSSLVAGLFLRRLGFDAEETVALIRSARPGALSNHSFVRLIGEA